MWLHLGFTTKRNLLHSNNNFISHGFSAHFLRAIWGVNIRTVAVTEYLSKTVRGILGGLAAAVIGISVTASFAEAQSGQRVVVGERYVPTIWVDPDGCEHWVMDDGWEGYMSPHVTRQGIPVCRRGNVCGVMNSDQLSRPTARISMPPGASGWPASSSRPRRFPTSSSGTPTAGPRTSTTSTCPCAVPTRSPRLRPRPARGSRMCAGMASVCRKRRTRRPPACSRTAASKSSASARGIP